MDVVSLGLAKADARRRYLPNQRRASIAGFGDSLLNNGGSSIAVVALTTAAGIGDTTLTVGAPFGGVAPDTQMTSDYPSGTLVQIGSEFAVTSAGPTVVSSGARYTLPLSAPLTAAHAIGTKVITHPQIQANNSPQPAFWAHLMSQGKLRYAGTYGHGGWTPSQLIATYLPLILQAKPGWCAVQAGRNRDATIDVTTANVIAIWDALLVAGIMPIGQTIPPQDGSTTTTQQEDELLNARLRSAAALRGIPFYDLNADMVDPATTGWLAAYQGDGTHPNPAGRKVNGQGLWNAVSPLLPALPSPKPRKNTRVNTGLHVFPLAQSNAKMLTTGGDVNAAASPLMPLGWKGSAAAGIGTFSVQNAPRGGGKSVRFARADGSTAGSTSVDILPKVTGSYATLIPGHKYRCTIDLQTTGLTAAFAASSSASIVVGLTNTGASGTTTFGVFSPISLDVDGTFTWDFECTAAQPTPCYPHVTSKGATAATAYTVEFWDVDILDLTVLGETTDWPILFA